MYILAFGIWSNNVSSLYRHHFVQSINQNKFIWTHFSSNTDCPQPISHEVVGLFNDILVKFSWQGNYTLNMPWNWLISLVDHPSYHNWLHIHLWIDTHTQESVWMRLALQGAATTPGWSVCKVQGENTDHTLKYTKYLKQAGYCSYVLTQLRWKHFSVWKRSDS